MNRKNTLLGFMVAVVVYSTAHAENERSLLLDTRYSRPILSSSTMAADDPFGRAASSEDIVLSGSTKSPKKAFLFSFLFLTCAFILSMKPASNSLAVSPTCVGRSPAPTDQVVEIKTQASHSVKWAYIANLLPRCIQPLVTIVLARLLTPADYCILGVSVAFVALAGMFQTMGLSQALNQREKNLNQAANVSFWSSTALGLE